MTAPMPHTLPYGLRKVVLTPYTDANGSVLSNTSYHMPIAQTLSFSETEEYDELRGDDKLAAIHGRGAEVDGSIEAGGLPIVIWSIISGGAVVETGVAPNRETRLRKKASDQRPYFRVDGQMISDSGGDVIARIYRCKCNGRIQADFRYGTFQITATDFKGTPLVNDDNDLLYEIIRRETKGQLPLTPEPNPLPVPSGLSVGTITATSVELEWLDLPSVDKFQVEQAVAPFDTWTKVSAANGGEPTGGSTVVTALTTATAYQFRVRSVVGTTEPFTEYGDPSAEVSATTT